MNTNYKFCVTVLHFYEIITHVCKQDPLCSPMSGGPYCGFMIFNIQVQKSYFCSQYFRSSYLIYKTVAYFIITYPILSICEDISVIFT